MNITVLKFDKKKEALAMQRKLYQNGLQCEISEKHPKRVTILAENPGLEITASLLELGINPSHMRE